jgi:deazaflavin-dependent oxidoreductase (nitroreductase family)
MSQVHAPPDRDEAVAAFRANERSWNAKVIDEFRANGGEVAAPYDDPPPMLLLHTIGAKSGKEHIVPMRGLPDGESLYVFASAHGSDRHPDWYYNIVANPDITIEKGTETFAVRATVLNGAERDAIFARHAARFPIFAEYERKLARIIPVIRLDRRGLRDGDGNQEGSRLNVQLLASVEREVLSWPGVSKEEFAGGRGRGGFQVPPATMFRFGRREIGHLHRTGEADLPFPRKIYDELIATGRAKPHGAGFAGVVTYIVREPDDVEGAVELFRLNYERATAVARS